MTKSDTIALVSAFEAAPQEQKQALAEKLAHEVAINAIYDQPPLLVGISKIYQIDERWHAEEARVDGRFVVVQTRQQLQQFLDDAAQEVALSFQVEGLTLTLLEATLDTCHRSKTVLFFSAE